MISVLGIGCSPAKVMETETAETEPAATEPAAVESQEGEQPTPEVSAGLPSDLWGEEMNLFSNIAFPEGYAVYAAAFENNFYYLYLTAQGKPEDIITYVSEIMGDNAQESIQQNIDLFSSDGFVAIHGSEIKDGLKAECDIGTIREDDYDYDYVEGCTLRFRAAVDDPSDYQKLIEDNYNLNSLSDVAHFFDLMPITGISRIYVRKNRNNAQIDAVYNHIEDVAGVLKDMKSSIEYENFDESINAMNLPYYGEIQNNIFFDVQNNSISIFQYLSHSDQNYKDYQPVISNLAGLGFENYIESDALCSYKDEAQNLSIAINIPQWGSRPDQWENNCVVFLKKINDYLLAIWYYPDEGKYKVQADKDDTSASYEYLVETGKFDSEQPDPQTVRAHFGEVYSGFEVKDLYMEGIEQFQNYVKDAFGMSIDQLYALAAQD